MLAKIAVVITLLLAAITAPAGVPQPEPAGYPAPAESAPVAAMADAPEPATATPVTLPTPAGRQCVQIVYNGYARTCGQWAPAAPILPTPTAAPQEGYPLP